MRDLIIIGAGPAGLTAGLYAARAKMTVLAIEKGLRAASSGIQPRWRTTPGLNTSVAQSSPRR